MTIQRVILNIILIGLDVMFMYIYLQIVRPASHYSRAAAVMAINLTGFMFLTSYLFRNSSVLVTLLNFLRLIPHPVIIILCSGVSLLFIWFSSENYGYRLSLSLINGFLLICSAEGRNLLIYSVILYVFLMAVVIIYGVMNICDD